MAWSRRKLLFSILILIVIALGLWFSYFRNSAIRQTPEVTRQNIFEEFKYFFSANHYPDLMLSRVDGFTFTISPTNRKTLIASYQSMHDLGNTIVFYQDYFQKNNFQNIKTEYGKNSVTINGSPREGNLLSIGIRKNTDANTQVTITFVNTAIAQAPVLKK